MAIEKRKGNSWRVLFPHPASEWSPPAQLPFPSEEAARTFDALWKLRRRQGRLGEVWAEVFAAEASAERSAETVVLGDFLIDTFFPYWKGTPGRGRSGPKSARATGEMADTILDHVFEATYERDQHGHAMRDPKTNARIVLSWGADALAHTPLHELDPSTALAFAAKLEAKLVGREQKPLGKEVRRKLLSILQQAFDHAVVVYPELYGRPNPFGYVRKPSQTGVQTVRAMKPDVVEVMRCDWQIIELLSDLRSNGQIKPAQARVLRELGWPIPEQPYWAHFSSAFISAFAYSSARPQELLGIPQTALEPPRLTVDRHNLNGKVLPGTKSTKYPRKRPLLIGPGAADLTSWRTWLNGRSSAKPMLLFPTAEGKALNNHAYNNWRERYYVPVALRNGLRDNDPNDPAAERSDGSPRPYALRHCYATLRVAAGHDTLAIERSMGTSLVREVYADVIEEYEERGVLDIDAEVSAARAAAPARSAANFRASAREAGLNWGLIEAITGTVFPAAAQSG
jgi:hypothetical protein